MISAPAPSKKYQYPEVGIHRICGKKISGYHKLITRISGSCLPGTSRSLFFYFFPQKVYDVESHLLIREPEVSLPGSCPPFR